MTAYSSVAPWSEGVSDAYVTYHDEEWGVPVRDDVRQFEFLVLEGAQAGLSWSTILHRREGYRKAFAGFDPQKVARFTPKRVATLLTDPGHHPQPPEGRGDGHQRPRIPRRCRRNSAVFPTTSGASWTAGPCRTAGASQSDVPATSPASDALSKDLKARGFRFVGSTIMYAHMQATGLINDHLVQLLPPRRHASAMVARQRVATMAARRASA